MDQTKIGKFIAQCRKEHGLTQEQLAEKLGVSNRAVSKWERGLNLPETASLFKMTQLFNVTFNEILSGEKIQHDQYIKKAEQNLAIIRANAETISNRLACYECAVIIVAAIVFFILVITANVVEISSIGRIIITISAIGLLVSELLIIAIAELKLKRGALYDECSKCHYKYVPTKKQLLLTSLPGFHSRYLKCPKCGQRNWHHETPKTFIDSNDKH